MKSTNNKSRRKFFGAMALGATAASLPFLTHPAYAESDQLAESKFEEADDWFKNIKGKHRRNLKSDSSQPIYLIQHFLNQHCKTQMSQALVLS